MTTATAPAPWAAFDEKLRRSHAVIDAGQKFRHLDGFSDDSLRDLLAEVRAAQAELAAINEMIVGTAAKIDAAVVEHQRATAPLQTILNDPAVTAGEKVRARESVIIANEKLEATVGPLRKTLEAADQQREVVRAAAGGTNAIEAAFLRNGPDAERLRVLAKAGELLETGVLFAASKRARDAEAALAFEKARLKQMAETWGLEPANVEKDQKRRHAFYTPDLERAAEFHGAVATLLASFSRQIADEAAQIRRRRIAELYR